MTSSRGQRWPFCHGGYLSTCIHRRSVQSFAGLNFQTARLQRYNGTRLCRNFLSANASVSWAFALVVIRVNIKPVRSVGDNELITWRQRKGFPAVILICFRYQLCPVHFLLSFWVNLCPCPWCYIEFRTLGPVAVPINWRLFFMNLSSVWHNMKHAMRIA